MGLLDKLFGKRKYGSDDGYLLPKYWQCIVCKAGKRKAGKRASYPVRVGVFLMIIEDKRFFQELDQTDRAAAEDYVQFRSGLKKQRPLAATKHLEDTTGLARDWNDAGFDAVYLCDAHTGELNRALETLEEKPVEKKRKKRPKVR